MKKYKYFCDGCCYLTTDSTGKQWLCDNCEYEEDRLPCEVAADDCDVFEDVE